MNGHQKVHVHWLQSALLFAGGKACACGISKRDRSGEGVNRSEIWGSDLHFTSGTHSTLPAERHGKTWFVHQGSSRAASSGTSAKGPSRRRPWGHMSVCDQCVIRPAGGRDRRDGGVMEEKGEGEGTKT
ncbi:hypothetical protein BD289DRAFT_433803 [Coniella lustricola]|uniref:Secreted protein n=1 Tax=Coniella lustricola TaxID=2025994 RepID=A0A2T3A878_9PEZI|nr:hypothetical protein BD289DRAFT_433803 [Coniella lustricola]